MQQVGQQYVDAVHTLTRCKTGRVGMIRRCLIVDTLQGGYCTGPTLQEEAVMWIGSEGGGVDSSSAGRWSMPHRLSAPPVSLSLLLFRRSVRLSISFLPGSLFFSGLCFSFLFSRPRASSQKLTPRASTRRWVGWVVVGKRGCSVVQIVSPLFWPHGVGVLPALLLSCLLLLDSGRPCLFFPVLAVLGDTDQYPVSNAVRSTACRCVSLFSLAHVRRTLLLMCVDVSMGAGLAAASSTNATVNRCVAGIRPSCP